MHCKYGMNTTKDVWVVGTEIRIVRYERRRSGIKEVQVAVATIVARTPKRFIASTGQKFIPANEGKPVAQQVCNNNPLYAYPVK